MTGFLQSRASKDDAMTRRATAFTEANLLSPIVKGTVIGKGGQGAELRLANGSRFRLTKEDFEEIGRLIWEHNPVWCD